MKRAYRSNQYPLWTDNLPIELDPEVRFVFINFLDRGLAEFGDQSHYLMTTYDPNDNEMVYQLSFNKLEAGQFHIAGIEISEYQDGDLFDTDYYANYIKDSDEWMSPVTAIKKYGTPEGLVRHVLTLFNEEANSPSGEFSPVCRIDSKEQLIQRLNGESGDSRYA